MPYRVVELAGLEPVARERVLGVTRRTAELPEELVEVLSSAGLDVATTDDYRVGGTKTMVPRLLLEHPEDERPVVFSQWQGVWRLEDNPTLGTGSRVRTLFEFTEEQKPERVMAFQRGTTPRSPATSELRCLDVANWTWGPTSPQTPVMNRVVLLIHGFNSSVEATFNPRPLPFGKPSTTYFGFNHETWFHDPDTNAQQLMRDLEPYRETLDQAEIHLIAHSRGGLVARSFFELTKKRGWKVARVITFGSPHQGTTLAKSAVGLFNVVLNQIIHALGVPTPAAHALGAALTSVVQHRLLPGVDAMVPGSKYLNSLPSHPALPPAERPCHGAEYLPSGFWSLVAAYLYTAFAFEGRDNDLVVDTDSMAYAGYSLVPHRLAKNHFEYFSLAPDLLSSAL